MAATAKIAAEIDSQLAILPTGSLSFFGEIFGGRIDNIHRVVAAEVMPGPDCLRVQFDEDERLLVWSPARSVIDDTQFVIGIAERVRWSWFSYGEPKTPDNLRFLDYRVESDSLTVSSDSESSQWPRKAKVGEPAVQMLR